MMAQNKDIRCCLKPDKVHLPQTYTPISKASCPDIEVLLEVNVLVCSWKLQ